MSMTREETLQHLLNQIPKNASCMYKEGFEDGFECTYDAVEKDFEAQIGFADIYIQDLEAQLKAKDEEIELLKQCVEEAIKRPMGVEPSLYSDYKMLKDTQ